MEKSLIGPESGFGVFSKHRFERGDSIGYFCGTIINKTQEYSDYAAAGIDPTGPIWSGTSGMGLHMMNDPTYQLVNGSLAYRQAMQSVNVVQHTGGHVYALRRIKIGEELLLEYNR